MNVLVIDVGTSSMRGILYDGEGRSLVSRQFRYHPCHRSQSWIEQPAEEFRHALETIAAEISEDAAGNEIDVISVTAQRSSVIPLDREGTPLMKAVMWQDSRNADICHRLEAENDTIFRKSGAGVNTVFSGGKMTWVRETHPEIYRRTAKFVNIPEYLIYQMTGNFISDYTYGSRSNLMNLRKRDWDPELLEIFRVDREKLCELREPGSVVGKLTGEFSRRTGLKTGIPVVSAGGDQQCAAVGQGVFREGTLSIVTGTGAFLVTASRTVPDDPDRGLICNCSSIPGEFILEASVLTCCSAFDWYCSNFYGDAGGYDRVNRDLAELYGQEEPSMVLPYFQGRSSSGWNPGAKALFADLTLSTSRRDLLKALVEGIFLEIRNNIEVLGRYVEISQAYISGGLTNSRIMNQMQADIYGMTLKHLENSESTALGALMVTLAQMGVYRDTGEAFERIRGRDRVGCYYPKPGTAGYYEEKRDRMNGLYHRIYGAGQDSQRQAELRR